MKIKRLVGGLAIFAMMAGVPAPFAMADGIDDDGVVVINGVEYGPDDGLIEEVEQFEIQSGGDPVGQVYGEEVAPQAVWGSSYAISTETVQLYYSGKAKAAGNVYQGKRIIRVCFWYTRGGKAVSSEKCSAARDVGGNRWAPGAEVTDGVWDSLNPVAPKTVFQIRTTRINP